MLPKKILLVLGQLILQFISCACVSVEVGSELRVQCPLAAPGASVQWTHNGQPVLLEGDRGWEVSVEGVASLSIGSVLPSDAGEWGCREIAAGHDPAEILHVLTLQVTSAPSPPHLELEGRRLLHQATVTAKEPHTLALHCLVTGARPPFTTIHWTRGDVNVTSSSELFVEWEESGSATSRSILQLNATREVHGEEVVCRAHHDTWRQGAAVSVSLNVLYDPSFSISRTPDFGLPLLSGMRVSLVCRVDANPPSGTPLWVRDDPRPRDPPTPQGGQTHLDFPQEREGEGVEQEVELVLAPAGEGDSGWYRCTTQHPLFGFFASFGYFLNVRAVDPSDATAPPPSGGRAEGCIPDGRPSLRALNRSLSVVWGQGALLSAHLCSPPLPHPPRVFWIVRQFVLRPGEERDHYVAHHLTTESGCWRVVLEVSPLSSHDSGEVVVVATNEEGAAHATFALNVTHAAPQHSTSPSTLHNTGVIGACAVLFWLLWTLDYR